MATKFIAVFMLLCTGVTASPAAAPLTEVIGVLEKLLKGATAEGEREEKEYVHFMKFCKEEAVKIAHDMKLELQHMKEEHAKIEELEGKIIAYTSEIQDLSGKIASNQGDFGNASAIRASEAKDFAAQKKELEELISTLSRAISILEKQLNSGSASMMQLTNRAATVTQAFAVLVQASILSSHDVKKLSALVQSMDESDEDSRRLGLAIPQPEVKAYESKSGGIVQTLEALMEKAQSQLAEAEKVEVTAKHNFELLQLSMGDEMDVLSTKIGQKKMALQEAKQLLADIKGELAHDARGEALDETKSHEVTKLCKLAPVNYAAEKADRDEEIAALTQAIEILKEAFSKSLIQSGVSFLQVSRSHVATSADLISFEAVRFVRDLAKKYGSQPIALLASRMESAVRVSTATGKDTFAKVKTMINDMIAKLESENSEDAELKAYCDKETYAVAAKKELKADQIAAFSTKIETTTALAAKIKLEIAELAADLKEMEDTIGWLKKERAEDHENYLVGFEEATKSRTALRAALKALKNYYDKEEDDGKPPKNNKEKRAETSSKIIEMLEKAEAVYSKSAIEMEQAENKEQETFTEVQQEYYLTLNTKQGDMHYKEKKAADLAQTLHEVSSDRDNAQKELEEALEYEVIVKAKCTVKPMSYSEKSEKRAAEIAGLKQALKILESEASLTQTKSIRFLRGSQSA